MIEFDKNILQTPLTNDDRDVLYKILLTKSNLETELDKYYNKLKDYVEKAVILLYPDQDKFKLSLKCPRIIKKGIRVYIEANKIDNLDNRDTKRYPTEYWNMEEGSLENKIKVSSIVSFQYPYLRENYGNYHDLLSKIKDSKLKEAIINTYKHYISILFNKTNFLIEYKNDCSWKNSYFNEISTWGNLFKEHKDWFELLYVERKERLVVEDKIKEIPKSNEELLKDLKGVLGI